MTAIRIYRDGTFVAVAAKTVDDGLAHIRAAVRAQGLSPHTPRGQALMEKLMHEMPKPRAGQPPVTLDLQKLQDQRTRLGQTIRMLKADIAKLEANDLRGPVTQKKLDDKTQQLTEEEQKYKGLELSIRRLKNRQSK